MNIRNFRLSFDIRSIQRFEKTCSAWIRASMFLREIFILIKGWHWFCWRRWVVNFMIILSDVCDGISMLVTFPMQEIYRNHLKSVTSISKLFQTYFVTNIHHQHRCTVHLYYLYYITQKSRNHQLSFSSILSTQNEGARNWLKIFLFRCSGFISLEKYFLIRF